MSDVGRVALRGDGGPRIGSGHLMRLRAVALELARRGVTGELVTALDGPIPDGFGAVHAIRAPYDAAHDPEREVPEDVQRRDAGDTRGAVDGGDPLAVLADHYALGIAWERSLRTDGVGRLGAIDDLARQHEVDVLVDPGLGDPGTGPSLVGPGRVLRGPAYAPLAPEHRPRPSRHDPEGRPRVVVTLGGGRSGIVVGLVGALRRHPGLTDVALDVVVPDPLEHDEVAVALRGLPRTTVHGHLPSLAALLDRADLVVGAGGSTAWERLVAGAPSVVVALAANQSRGCRALDAAGLAVHVEDGRDVEAVASAAAEALSDAALRDRARTVGPLLVDGRGAGRVALALVPPAVAPRLRPATVGDAAALLAMANDPATRRASRDPAGIDPVAHLRWLTAQLADPSSLLLVAAVDDLPVGQVRFRRLRTDAWELSYGLDAAARGNRWADGMLRDGVLALRRRDPQATIVAVVRAENVPSRRTFERLGFVRDPGGQGSVALGAAVDRGFEAYLLPSDAVPADATTL